MGVLCGIVLSYIFLVTNPELFIQPIIANSVKATVAAQTATIPIPTTIPPTPTLGVDQDIVLTDYAEIFHFDG
jgi:hypothetical protein